MKHCFQTIFKFFLITLVVFITLSVPTYVYAAIEFVNEVNAYNSGGSTSIALPSGNHTAGNLLVVLLSGWNAETVSSVTDTAGNTYYWTGQRSPYTNTDSGFTEIWYAYNITGGASNVVTVNYSGTVTYREVTVYQYSGIDTSDPYDVGNTGGGGSSSGTSQSTGSANTTQADEVIAAVYAEYDAGSCTAGSGFTVRYDGTYFCSEGRIVSSTGSYNSSLTYSASVQWTASHATFKAASVVSAPTVTSSAADTITDTTATLNGNVTDNGGEDATTCGFAWGTVSSLSGGDTATTTDSSCPSGTGAFDKGLTGLSDNTTHYFRAYATNTGGDGLGSILNFTTNELVLAASVGQPRTLRFGTLILLFGTLIIY